MALIDLVTVALSSSVLGGIVSGLFSTFGTYGKRLRASTRLNHEWWKWAVSQERKEVAKGCDTSDWDPMPEIDPDFMSK